MQVASERRGSVRHPVTLTATMEVEGAGRWPCQIADFCSEGLLLRYSAETSCRIKPYFTSVMPPVRVIFRDSRGGRYFSLYVQPVRCIDAAMGAQFTRSDPAAIDALLWLCSKEEAAPGKGGDRAASILRHCTQETLSFVRPLLTKWFKAVDKRLKDCAQRAGNDRQAHQFMDAATKIESRQHAFWQMMSEAVLSQLVESSGRQSGEGARLQLDLVEKGEFEDWLLLRVLVTKAENQFRGLLLPLKMRLDKAGVMLQTGHQNPLGPVLVCEAFRQAQEHLDCGRPVNKVAFQVFEQEVVCHLEELYSTLNQILARQGVLPDLELSRYQAEVKPKVERIPRQVAGKPQPAAEADGPPAEKPTIHQPKRDHCSGTKAAQQANTRASAGLHQSPGPAQSAFATVERLLTVLRQSRTAAGPKVGAEPEPGAIPLSLPDLLRELGKLPEISEKPPSESPKQRVVDQVSSLGTRRLEPEQETTIEVVHQFFISLQQSPRLDTASRGQLQRLYIPVLRAVLEKRHHFEDEDSPVRGVLNRIAQLGARGARPNPVLQRKVDSIIERIHRDFDKDAHIFRSALSELGDLVERQNLAYRRSVERVTAAAEGTQKVEDARMAVSQELERRLAGQRVPRALVALLNGGWRDLLSLTFVRRGPDSNLWQEYVGVVDTLMALMRDPETTVDLPDLLRVIQEGLATVSGNQAPAGQTLDELKRFLTCPDRDPRMLIAMPPRSDNDCTSPEELGDSRQDHLQRWMSRARGLRIGDWMKMQDGSEKPSYMRLAWVGRGFSRFVFVNHQGMKVAEMDLLRLASHLQKGTVVSEPDYERPIVDESIDRMVQRVYEQISLASIQDELTGLPSRRAFERFLARWLQANAVADVVEPAEQKILAILELQYLRTLSHKGGFSAGDEALCQVANLLRTLAPADAGLARLGGSRFALLLDAKTAEARVRQLVERIEGLSLIVAGEARSLSANVGLALDQPGLATPEQWLSAAEEALTGLRQRGECGRAWYAPGPEQVSEQARITAKVSELEDMDSERVLLRRQKLLPLHGDTLMGVQHQVLISLYDDCGQLTHGPGFVRMAERQNRIQLVDRWLVGHMLDWVARNPKAAESLGGLGISLSGRSLADAALLEFIFERMSQQKVFLEHLWFEIAEAAAVSGKLDQGAELIPELRDLGCRFCLGGFSGRRESYELLERLPVDRVKLDESFMADLLHSKSDQAAVRSMVEMTHFLGREVVACAVEDRETLQLLCGLGIDYAQGYAVEAPRPLEG